MSEQTKAATEALAMSREARDLVGEGVRALSREDMFAIQDVIEAATKAGAYSLAAAIAQALALYAIGDDAGVGAMADFGDGRFRMRSGK